MCKLNRREFCFIGFDVNILFMNSPFAGKFIVLDGAEGCGKTTQIALLTDKIARSGARCLKVREPGATSIGERVRELLLDPANSDMSMRCEMLLYMAARAQLMSQLVLPALNDGQCVVADRFLSSTLAYQTGGEGMAESEILAVGAIAIQNRSPDLTLILDMPVERAHHRIQRAKDRIEQRPLDYHNAVRNRFLDLAQKLPNYRLVNADKPIDIVHEQIWSFCNAHFKP